MSKAVMLLTLGESAAQWQRLMSLLTVNGTQNSAWDRSCGPTAWVRVDGSQEGSLEEVVFRLRHEG